MRHRRLFDVRVRHDFFPGGTCPDLRIEPRAGHASGARVLARHRLVARPQPDGLEIVGPVDGDDQPFVAFAGDLRLAFDVRVDGNDFAHYTDLTGWSQNDRPSYHGSDPAGGGLSLGTSFAAPPGVVAGIEISGIAAAWLVRPPRFVLEFSARQALWVFYLLTTRAGDLPPQIVDGEPGRALVFEPTLLSSANTTAADDPVGHRLLARHPGHRCFRVISDRPIACRRAPLRRLGLHLGDELLIRELPNPSIHEHATIRVAPAQEPRNSLFRVIEF